MTWQDFFGCDWDEYAQRISEYTDQRLCEQEIVKLRQQISASCAIGSGVGGAAFTMGASLAASVIGSRRYRVARKKHGLIQNELMRRGIPLHETNYKDYLIPVVASVVGQGVGIGLGHIAMDITNTIPLGQQIPTPTGSTTIQAVAEYPSDAEHFHEVNLAADGIKAGIVPGSESSQLNLAEHTSWIPAPNVENAAEFHAGMLLAQKVENAVVISVAEKLSAISVTRDTHVEDGHRTRLVDGVVVGGSCSDGSGRGHI
ncbi:hypothetical protein DDE83_006629 [Stemphylium lycopersici]|uniref:Uncharacterized protein n=1 Tax=Stemphylium lycopersici TaxID=183478 RepID=A0A364MYG2_STELY|nr:hypothetical protein DDE83_006629 [Stemphylium lycopersici]